MCAWAMRELGAVLAPVHQRHQQPIFSAKFGRSTKGGQMFLQSVAHGKKRGGDDAGQALELLRLEMLHISVKHVHSIRHLCKRSNVITPNIYVGS